MKRTFYLKSIFLLCLLLAWAVSAHAALIGNEALMQNSTLDAFTGDPNDDTEEDEVDDIDDLLSNYGSRLWEE